MKSKPLISIITASFNRAQFIETAIISVLNQDYPNIEHIVIDGGSTDGTLDLLKKYSHLHVISERDKGVYDAFNKGAGFASGEIIGFLNSDDFYENNIFNCVAEKFSCEPDLDAVIGKAAVFREISNSKKDIIKVYDVITQDKLIETLTIGVPIINAWFFNKSLFKNANQFDIRYKYGADRVFLLNLLISGIKTTTINKSFYYYRSHPGSLTINSNFDSFKRWTIENIQISKDILHEKHASAQIRRALMKMHDHYSFKLVTKSLKYHYFNYAFRYGWQAWQFNIFWPIYFMTKLLRNIYEKISNASQ